MNLKEIDREFDTEGKCIAFLERLRWPDGVVCPKCQGKDISAFTSVARGRSKNTRGTEWKRSLYDCLNPKCRNQFSVKSGTLFHDSHLPLRTWFKAIVFMCQAKKGRSANEMGRTIGCAYKTAWYLCHRIREAMNSGELALLTGTIEVDETYVGGKPRKGEPRRTYFERKIPVMGVIQRDGEIRFKQVERANAETVKNVMAAYVSPDVTRIITDESVIYPFGFSPEQMAKHETICHMREYARGDIHVNNVESAFSLFKRALVGSFHRMSVKHCDRYL